MLDSQWDQVEAMTLADRIILMREGIIEQVGSPIDLFEKPASKFVATFIVSPTMNMVEATVVSTDKGLIMRTNDNIEIPLPQQKKDKVHSEQKISFGFRAEDFVPIKYGSKPDNSWDSDSKANLSEPLGTETLIFTNLGNKEVVRRMFAPEQVEAGSLLNFSLNLDRVYLFDDSAEKII